MRCYACDAENSPEVRFCTSCGTLIAPVTWAQPGPAAPSFAGPFSPAQPQAGMPAGGGPSAYPAGYADPSAYGAYASAAHQGGAAYANGAYQPGASYPAFGYAPAQQVINNI